VRLILNFSLNLVEGDLHFLDPLLFFQLVIQLLLKLDHPPLISGLIRHHELALTLRSLIAASHWGEDLAQLPLMFWEAWEELAVFNNACDPLLVPQDGMLVAHDTVRGLATLADIADQFVILKTGRAFNDHSVPSFSLVAKFLILLQAKA